MSIDGTGSPGQDDEPAATSDRGDIKAEQTGGQQTTTNNDRGHRRAETLTREQYADAMRADGPPIRPDSADARQSPSRSGSDDRADTEEADRTADRDAPGPHEPQGDGDYAVTLHDEPGRAGLTSAEPLAREEYADAMRGNGLDDGHQERSGDPDTESARDTSTTAAAVTHFHGEFKDQQLDLYTDGTHWATADTPRTQDTVSETGEIPDRLPTGEELVDSAGEDSSRLERFRRKLYEQGDDALDSVEKNTNIAHDIFSHPPTSSYEATPTPEPHIYEAQHSVMDPGSMATAIFMFGLVIDRALHWVVGHYDKHAKGS